jgi:hypothetical protein
VLLSKTDLIAKKIWKKDQGVSTASKGFHAKRE